VILYLSYLFNSSDSIVLNLNYTWRFFCNQQNKTIFQISDISSYAVLATSVLAPNRGWFIFGGYESTLLTSQKLQTLSGNWSAGPNLFQNASDSYLCGVQVNI
jgi:hypothetical protein